MLGKKSKQSSLSAFFKKKEKISCCSESLDSPSDSLSSTPIQQEPIQPCHAIDPVAVKDDPEVCLQDDGHAVKKAKVALQSARRVIVDSDDEAEPSLHKSDHSPRPSVAPMTPALKRQSSSLGQFKMGSSVGETPVKPAKSTPSLSAFRAPGSDLSSSLTPAASRTESTICVLTSAEFKEKNEERYAWLEHPKDANGNSPQDEDYDPRTLHVPQYAWNKFTPFEKQFWEIKCKQWDTVVFFKKGKFFELYENDADIGHQQFDLKLTDRVNMRMVGVPESSFHHWASQFIARGYKVAKVEQMENAVGKQIRDKQSAKREEKIIRRELTSVLTTGTL
ncbi:DNA mismatch repair protein msh6, partial [Kappamyces sp. JEL0680]